MSDHVLETRARRTAAPAAGRSWRRAAWRQYRLERRMFWRNPTAAFFNFLLPLLFLGMFGAIFAGSHDDLQVIVPGIAAMSVMTTTFTALAHNLTFLREAGILKRVRGTPLPASAYLAGIAGSAVTNTVLQLAIITVSGKVIFGVDWPDAWASLALFAALGVLCFASLGVALSHVIPNFESAPAYVNAVFLPVIMVSGVFYDADNVPAVLRAIAETLPLKHLVDGMYGAMVAGEGAGSHVVALLVLGAWTAAGCVLAVRGFSWEQRRQ